LIGLHFPKLLTHLGSYKVSQLAFLTLMVPLTVIVLRLLWTFALTYGSRFFFPAFRARHPYPSWQNVFIIAWTGMRGVVSLATALALPLTIADGSPFPHRSLIIFLAFGVILVTLLLHGMTLPWLARKMSLHYDGKGANERWHAQREAAETAWKRLYQIARDDSIPPETLERIQSHYRDRLASLGEGPNSPLPGDTRQPRLNHPIFQMESYAWKEALEAERQAVIDLRQNFKIGDDIMNELLRDIDLLHNRFANDA
jgi:CPA1 family monovalent cation:H+ antiporter